MKDATERSSEHESLGLAWIGVLGYVAWITTLPAKVSRYMNDCAAGTEYFGENEPARIQCESLVCHSCRDQAADQEYGPIDIGNVQT